MFRWVTNFLSEKEVRADNTVYQYKGYAYRTEKVRMWYFPFLKLPILRNMGRAMGDEPQLFPAPPRRNNKYAG